MLIYSDMWAVVAAIIFLSNYQSDQKDENVPNLMV